MRHSNTWTWSQSRCWRASGLGRACHAGWTGSPRRTSPGRTNLFLVIISAWAYLDVVVGLLHPRHGKQDLAELHPAPHLATLLAQHLAPHQLFHGPLHVPINHDARAHLHMGVRQKQMSLELELGIAMIRLRYLIVSAAFGSTPGIILSFSSYFSLTPV